MRCSDLTVGPYREMGMTYNRSIHIDSIEEVDDKVVRIFYTWTDVPSDPGSRALLGRRDAMERHRDSDIGVESLIHIIEEVPA